MKRLRRGLSVLVLLFTISTALYAQGSGWTVDPHDYQYDMTVYAGLKIDGTNVTDFTNYEVAAFVGNECRGVSTVDQANGTSWLYLRVRSNKASGETITFKVFDKEKNKISSVEETIEFTSQGLVGQPSNPQILTPKKYTLGDVNDDGKINITDVTACFQIMAGKTNNEYIKEAADVTEDSKVNITDVTAIFQIMAGKYKK